MNQQTMSILSTFLFFGIAEALRLDNDPVSEDVERLSKTIFDVGMNRGDDTQTYLERGYKVLAIEANPIWVKRNSAFFHEAIASGQLVILNKVIDLAAGQEMAFWIPQMKEAASKVLDWLDTFGMEPTISMKSALHNESTAGAFNATLDHVMDEFASASKDNSCDRLNCSEESVVCSCNKAAIQSVSCADLIKQHGVPHYLKVDIEGFDGHCMLALAKLPCEMLPPYLSFEEQSAHPWSAASSKEIISALSRRGYSWKLSRQEIKDHAMLGSGPFGEEVADFDKGQLWSDESDASKRSRQCRYGDSGGDLFMCDVHGKLSMTACVSSDH